jgi:Flp pilus assembly protein TadD
MEGEMVSRTTIAAIVLLSTAMAAQAADTTPSSPPPAAGIKAAQLKIDSGDFRGAVPILTAYTKDHPNDADRLNLMGYSLRKTGQTDQAMQYYNRALALNPKHLGVNEYLGELYVELGQMDKAKERLTVLQAACGNCGQEQDLAAFIQKGPGAKASSR